MAGKLLGQRGKQMQIAYFRCNNGLEAQ